MKFITDDRKVKQAINTTIYGDN